MLKLLTAQFALQDNDLAAAARGFADASALSSDPALAEEATRLALSQKDWPLATRSLARWRELAPAAPGIAQAHAWIALGEKRMDEARAGLVALATRGGDDAWRLVAQLLLNADDKIAAASLLDDLVRSSASSASESNQVALSQLAYKLGDKALARRIVDAAVVRFPGIDAYTWSARLAIDGGDKAAARAIYSEGLTRAPESLRLRSGYAALLADSGDNAAAARALVAGPQDDTTYAARAAYAARAVDKAALSELYREIESDKTERSSKRLYLLGQVAELIGKLDAALAWYREVPIDDEHGFEAQLRVALVLDQLDRVSQALDQLHRVVEMAAGDSEQQRAAWLAEADLLAHRQRHADALAVYDRALASLPDDWRLLYARALLAVDQGDLAGGERDLRRVIELRPDDAEALNALGYTLADRSAASDPRQREALELIERALKLKPDEAAIIDSMGWVRYRLGELDASVQALRRAYAKQPDADIAAHLGEVLWAQGQREEARRIWDEGRKKDAKNKALLETIRRMTQ
ncbi:MAG: tetratricopeptide repeat protein [Dokdonella sp.]|uniref:tetratricopeptide repeat protein n=1 Tax=Dokdonella sp. TaxID=2291710 RepID=UPI003F7F3630